MIIQRNKAYKYVALFCLLLLFSASMPLSAFAEGEKGNVITVSAEAGTYANETTQTVPQNANAPIRTKTVTHSDLGLDKIELMDVELSGASIEEKVRDRNTKFIATLADNQTIPDSIHLKLVSHNNSYKEVTKITQNVEGTPQRTELLKGYPFFSDIDYQDNPDAKNDFLTYGKYAAGEISEDEATVKNAEEFDVTMNKEKGYGKITFYAYMRNDASLKYTFTVIIKTAAAKVPVDATITSATILEDSAQWAGIQELNSERQRANYFSRSGDPAKVEIILSDDVDLYLDGEKQECDNKKAIVSLSVSEEGVSHELLLKKEGFNDNIYTLVGYRPLFDDMPDKVVDYLCIASQYTGGGTPAGIEYGSEKRAVSTLRGVQYTAIPADLKDEAVSPASLGNFGGYITYYYEKPVKDDPNNPYGIDFIVCGNSYGGSNGLAEPGNVLVSEDGDHWYTLAGSIHYDSTCVWDCEVVYKRTDGGGTTATFKLPEGITIPGIGENGTTITKMGGFPKASDYSLHCSHNIISQFSSETVKGTFITRKESLDDTGNIIPVFPAFGYADCGDINDSSKVISNTASNPYTGFDGQFLNALNRTDGFDLAWAVDKDGKPKSFENGIHYIKVQTASMIDNSSSGIGEKSTEVNGIRLAQKADNDETIGKTKEPEKIIVDGTELELENGVYEYDAKVNGVFDVQVIGAEKNSNIYINSIRNNVASFKSAPHGIVRVIIQSGKAAPVIYYLTIKDEGGDDTSATEIVFDATGGAIGGESTLVQYYDKNSAAKDFPTPTSDGWRGNYVFEKWVDSEGNVYTGYDESMSETLSLQADWITALEAARRNAVKEVNEHVDKDDYSLANQKQIEQIISDVIEAINTAEDEDSIVNAKETAIGKLDELKTKDEERLEFEEKIQALLDKDEIITSDKEAIESLRATFEDFSDEEKAKVDVTKLELLEARLAVAKAKQDAEDAANAAATNYDNAIKDKNAKIAELNQKLSDAAKSLDEAQKKLKEASEKAELDKAAIQKAQADLAEAEAALKKAKEQIELDEAAKKQSDTDLAAALSELQKVKEELSMAQTQLAELTVKRSKVTGAKVSAKKKKALLKWNSLGEGYRYEIYRSTKKNKGFKKVKTVSSAKATVKKLKSRKTYYFKVRAFKELNGKVINTGYSKVLKAKIK